MILYHVEDGFRSHREDFRPSRDGFRRFEGWSPNKYKLDHQ